MSPTWTTRTETGADAAAVRDLTLAAFDTPLEADLVDALREDPAWIDGLSLVAEDGGGRVVAHALLTRCHIDDVPALCLGPCSVRPEHQGRGAGSAVIRAALAAAAEQGERFVVVLGHPSYYPRFGFGRASVHGIGVSIEVPDEALMALSLDMAHPSPATTLNGRLRRSAPYPSPATTLNGRLRRSTPRPLPAGTVRYAPPFGI
ncbi:putative N-acetyltransferase YhbS [Nocardiopsis sp. Huas11]|nr:N-acetyltransferase [Nocardiopsis sp. Huas11]RKS08332.1 putative N-acetyltransferase YhbS [Nocardiopsis sp. Huas11]